jgi:hypothetical protein
MITGGGANCQLRTLIEVEAPFRVLVASGAPTLAAPSWVVAARKG